MVWSRLRTDEAPGRHRPRPARARGAGRAGPGAARAALAGTHPRGAVACVGELPALPAAPRGAAEDARATLPAVPHHAAAGAPAPAPELGQVSRLAPAPAAGVHRQVPPLEGP